MKAHVLTGSKTEIAESVARINGEIREVIVLIDEPPDSATAQLEGDIFAEMESYMVRAGGADYSRQSLYMRQDGE